MTWVSETFQKEKLFRKECFEQPWLQVSLSAPVCVPACVHRFSPAPQQWHLCGARGQVVSWRETVASFGLQCRGQRTTTVSSKNSCWWNHLLTAHHHLQYYLAPAKVWKYLCRCFYQPVFTLLVTALVQALCLPSFHFAFLALISYFYWGLCTSFMLSYIASFILLSFPPISSSCYSAFLICSAVAVKKTE